MQSVPRTADLARRLDPMFSSDRPVAIRMWAVLEGTISGRIVVDRLPQPTVALVQALTEGTTYIAGAPTAQQLADALMLLRATSGVAICLWADNPLLSILPDAPSYVGGGIDFTDRSPAVDLERLGSVPAGYRIRSIDTDIVPALAGYDYYVSMFGSVERALDQTIGYCLMRDEAVVSEAVAGPLTRCAAELGIGTAEAYRRQGLGTVTAARVIQACEARGYQAYWNTSQQNIASAALARRLGFQTKRPFRVLAWATAT